MNPQDLINDPISGANQVGGRRGLDDTLYSLEEQLRAGQPVLPKDQALQEIYGKYGEASGASMQEVESRINEIYAPYQTAGGTGTGGTGYGGTGGPSRASINSRYDKLQSQLDKSRNKLNQREGRFLNQVEDEFSTNKGILQRSKKSGLQNLNRARERVQENKATTLSELDKNIRNAFQAGTIQLGNFGAGDSSAVGDFSFALTKLQNQNRSDVLRQADSQYNDINLSMQQLDTEFQNQMAELELYRRNERRRIAEQFAQQRDAIQREKVNADFERAQALDGLLAQSAQQAANNIAQVDQQAQTFADQLSINRAQIQQDILSGANYETQDMSFNKTGGELALGRGASFNPRSLYPVRNGRDEEQQALA